MHPGDDIVDARMIDDNTALVITLSASGYDIGTVALTPMASTVFVHTDVPAFDYSFDNSSQPNQLQNTDYHGIGELTYSGLAVDIGFANQASLVWTDPLEHHAITVGGQNTDLIDTAYLGYSNTQFLPASIIYTQRLSNKEKGEEDAAVNGIGKSQRIDKKRDQGFVATLNDTYTFGKRHLSWWLAGYQDLSSRYRSPLLTNIGYNYDLNFGLNLLGYSNLGMNGLLRATADVTTIGLKAQAGQALWSDWHVSATAEHLVANTKGGSANIADQAIYYSPEANTQALLAQDFAIKVLPAFRNDRSFKSSSIATARVQYASGFDLYSPRVPIALADTHFFVYGKRYALGDQITNPTEANWDITATGIGATFLTTVLYNFLLPITIAQENYQCGNQECEVDSKTVFNLSFSL